jgi:hypothetical protein
LGNPLEIRLGRVVEIPREEARRLGELTYEAQRIVRHQRVGWFAAYMACLNEQNRICKRLIGLSHQ